MMIDDVFDFLKKKLLLLLVVLVVLVVLAELGVGRTTGTKLLHVPGTRYQVLPNLVRRTSTKANQNNNLSS